MKKERISEILENIDPKYIDEATLYPESIDGTPFYPRKKKLRYSVMKWGAVAACFAVILVGALVIVPSIRRNGVGRGPGAGSTESSPNTVMVGGIARPYGNKTVYSDLIDRAWQWEYLTVFERYTSMELYGKPFHSKAEEIGEELLGDTLGSYEVSGYDVYTGRTYSQTFEVRQIKGISDDLMTAVKMEGKYYIFKNNEYAPPSKLGKLLDSYSLADAVELHSFSTCEGYTETGRYYLENDDMIWQILDECRNAPFDEKDFGELGGENCIQFSVTSETLGVYKVVLDITENGYLTTNVFDWGYVYYIGEDAANRIISYATENAEEAQPEPYAYSVMGTLTGIYDGYFIIDDSILCKDPNDGMEFKVPTDDLRIRRFVDPDNGEVRVGGLVRIEFTGEIDISDGNKPTEIISISEVKLYDKAGGEEETVKEAEHASTSSYTVIL